MQNLTHQIEIFEKKKLKVAKNTKIESLLSKVDF